MSDEKIFDLELTNEQWAAYVEAVDVLVERRRREGALISIFDLIAGASLLFFASGNNLRMPIKWVIAAVRHDLLPESLETEVANLRQQIDDLADMKAGAVEMLATMHQLSVSAQALNLSIRELQKRVEKVKTSGEATLAKASNFPT